MATITDAERSSLTAAAEALESAAKTCDQPLTRDLLLHHSTGLRHYLACREHGPREAVA